MSNIEILLLFVCVLMCMLMMGLALLIGKDPDDREGNKKKQKGMTGLALGMLIAISLPYIIALVIRLIYS